MCVCVCVCVCARAYLLGVITEVAQYTKLAIIIAVMCDFMIPVLQVTK